MLEYIKDHWKPLLVVAGFILSALAIPTYQHVKTWYYDRDLIVKIGDITRADFKNDDDWLDCTYNCALQVEPVKPGLCMARCDQKYQVVSE